MFSPYSSDLFSSWLDDLPQACFLVSVEQCRIEYANRAAARLSGHQIAHLKMLRWTQLTKECEKLPWPALVDWVREGESHQCAVVLNTAQGYQLELEFQVSYLRHQGREFLRMVQHSAAEPDRDYPLDRLTDGYWRWDYSGTELYISRRLGENLQRPSAEREMPRASWLACVHPDDRRRLEQMQQRLLEFPEQKYELEYRYRLPDGDWRWLQERASISRHEGESQMLAVVHDITERRQLSAEAEAMRARFEDYARSASDWFWETDPYLKLTFVSENLSTSTGVQVSQLVGQSLYTLMGEAQAGTRIQLQLTQPFRGTRVQLEGAWVSLSGRPFYDAQGVLKGYRGVGQDIHSQVLLEQEIRNVREGMDIMMKHVPIGVALKQEDGNFLHANPHFLELVGCERDQLAEFYRQDERLHQQDDDCDSESGIRRIEFEYQRDGERRIYSAMKFSIVQEINGPMVAIFLQDISAERAQQFEQQKSALVFNHISEGLLITDAAMNILDMNDSLLKRSGYTREQLQESTPKIFQSGRHDRGFYREMRQTLENRGGWSGDIWNRGAGGEVYRQHVAIQAVKGEDDEVRNYVAFYSSSQDNRARSDGERFATLHDPLTSLVNPLLFQDRMKQSLARARRRRYPVSFFLLDLVKFRDLNRQHGHDAGDQVLKKLARRLSEIAREEDTVCRWSADCFVVMMEDLDDTQQQEIRERLSALFDRPLSLNNGEQLSPVLELRTVNFPQDGATLNKLSQRLQRELDR